nr:PD-(D/E)XK motif protein [Pedobacter panaciterrae]
MKLNWDILYNDSSTFPRLLQFGEFADDRFRYGINDQIQHCLYFHFPVANNNWPVEPIKMANLSFEESLVSGKPTLILTLLNDNLKNQFSDLILSIVSQTKVVDDKSAKSQFIALCNEWFEMFDPSPMQLSRFELQGIFAELIFLQHLLDRSDVKFNSVLESWKGPFGKGHDFELGEQLFEIKSITEGVPLVNISSEFQLDYLNGQKLYLVVCQFFSKPIEGTTISFLINEIADILRSQTGTRMNLFWTALGKTGLSGNNIHEFDNQLFQLQGKLYYSCNSIDFPSLRRSLLPDAIRNIKYEIALSGIEQFKLTDLTSFI